MFGFVKQLQEIFLRLKRNKKLWFTSLTVISVSGIIFSMYMVMTLTSSVSEEVYASMSETYKQSIKNKVDNKTHFFEKSAIILLNDKLLLNAIEKHDAVLIAEHKDSINKMFLKEGFTQTQVNFYSTLDKKTILRSAVISAMTSKNTLSGVEVMQDGVYYVMLKPLIKSGNVYGIIEIRESINTLKDEFETQESSYLFLLNRNVLGLLSIEAKNGRYEDINEDFVIESAKYDTKFKATMLEIKPQDFKEMRDVGHIVVNGYYRSVEVVTDINGADIGMIVVGEFIEKEGGFVNIADGMTKTITTISLGLVMSILLFMF